MKKQLINLAFIFMAIGLICLPGFAASPGSLDPSFGMAGKVISNFSGNNVLNDVAVQDDGKIVYVGNEALTNFLVVRYLANGEFDPNFNGAGFVTTDFGFDDIATAVEIQSDGKMVVCGTSNVNNSGIARYNSNGSLDTTFDGDGKQTINSVACFGLAMQSDGKIVGIGNSVGIDPVIFRLNQNGTFDTTFGTNGFVSITGSGTGNGFRDVKIQQDGKIVAVGVTNNGTQGLVARCNPNGTLDTAFGSNGLVILNAQSSSVSLAIDPIDNAIVVLSQTTANAIRITRFTPGVSISILFIQPVPNIFRAGDIIITPDRKILISNLVASANNVNGEIRLLRLTQDLQSDGTFGSFGNLNTRIPASGPPIVAFSGDKLVVGSTVITVTSSTKFQLTRHNLSNTPTATSDFDGDGVTDVAIYRPSVGQWFVLRSSDNSVFITQFGLNGDVPIDGDFDGDGRNDLAIFRPSNGVWFFQRSSDNTVLGATFGIGTDKPIPGDYDKDGKTDLAVFRPSTGEWFVLRSSSNFATFFGFQFGQNGDIPISSERK